MDANHFDALARTLTTAGPRRRALTSLVSGALGLALGASSTEDIAAKKKPCPPCKKRKRGKCKKAPNGTGCSGGTCQNGSCVADGCVSTCGPKSCGPDGCGGSCGICGDNQPCLNGTCCTRTCARSNACGPNGCDGSCGNCPAGSICSAMGVCACGSGEPPCQGLCRPACTGNSTFGTVRHPETCGCCYPNGTSGLDEATCDFFCCSELCTFVAGSGWTCVGRKNCHPCTFDAQCQIGECVGGQCGEPSTTLCQL